MFHLSFPIFLRARPELVEGFERTSFNKFTNFRSAKPNVAIDYLQLYDNLKIEVKINIFKPNIEGTL
jgi:hypothetical protein